MQRRRLGNFFAMEAIANLFWVLCEHLCFLPPALLLTRQNQSPDAVRSRNLSKSTLAHDAVAAAVSHKHHLIIRVGAGLIRFVYGSHSKRGHGANPILPPAAPLLSFWQNLIQSCACWHPLGWFAFFVLSLLFLLVMTVVGDSCQALHTCQIHCLCLLHQFLGTIPKNASCNIKLVYLVNTLRKQGVDARLR